MKTTDNFLQRVKLCINKRDKQEMMVAGANEEVVS